MSHFKAQYISISKDNQIIARGKVNNDTVPVAKYKLATFGSKEDAIHSVFLGLLSGEFKFTRHNKNDFNIVYRSTFYDWDRKRLEVRNVENEVLADLLVDRYKDYKKIKSKLPKAVIEIASDRYILPYRPMRFPTDSKGIVMNLGFDEACIFLNREVAKSYFFPNSANYTHEILELPKISTDNDLTDCMRCENSFIPNRIIRTMFGLSYQDEVCNNCY